MKRPSFQFYPSDWQSNINLRRCSHPARGAWMDIMCALHDSDEYGILRWSLKDISMAVGAPTKLLNELVQKGVLKGSDKQIIDAYTYTPRSGRKEGDPVILIPVQSGPLWYSSRMVKDEYIRTIRGDSTRFGETPKSSPKGGMGEPNGDGSSTSSPSSSSPSGEREKSAPAPVSPPAPIKTNPTQPPAKPSSQFAETMPTENAKRMDRIQAWINSMDPKWKARPHFTRAEQEELMGVLRFVQDLTDTDWRSLRAYMDTLIEEKFIKEYANGKTFWQPNQRGQFVGAISDVLSHHDRWVVCCRKAGITINLGTENP